MSSKLIPMSFAAVATVAASLSAQAADLPVKAPLYKAPPPPMYSWTGFYLGGNAGYTWDHPTVDVTTINTFVNTPALSALGATAGPATALAGTAGIRVRSSGFIGGGQIGYNFQTSPSWLVGIEADIQGIAGSNGSGGLIQVAPRAGFPGNTITAALAVSERVTYLGTLRGRLGVIATPGFLAYATGGLAYGGAQANTAIAGMETPNTGSTPTAGFGGFSDTRTGYTVGGGLEWMFAPKWSFKAEYLYYNLGTVSYNNGPLTSFLTGTTTLNFIDASASSVRFDGNIVRGGINYHF